MEPVNKKMLQKAKSLDNLATLICGFGNGERDGSRY